MHVNKYCFQEYYVFCMKYILLFFILDVLHLSMYILFTILFTLMLCVLYRPNKRFSILMLNKIGDVYFILKINYCLSSKVFIVHIASIYLMHNDT